MFVLHGFVQTDVIDAAAADVGRRSGILRFAVLDAGGIEAAFDLRNRRFADPLLRKPGLKPQRT